MGHKNPSGNWVYEGEFTVELVPGTDLSRVPPLSCTIDGNTVRVLSGRAKQSMGAIQFTSDGQQFYWGYKALVCIRKADGSLLWQNKDYVASTD